MNTNVKAFDILIVDFGEAEFAGEQAGKRPAVVIQNTIGNTHSGTTIVIPLTSQIKNIDQPTHALFGKGTGGLHKDSMLLGECIRQVSKKRIISKIGSVADNIEAKRILKRVYDANFEEVE